MNVKFRAISCGIRKLHMTKDRQKADSFDKLQLDEALHPGKIDAW